MGYNFSKVELQLGDYERDSYAKLTLTRNRDGVLEMRTLNHPTTEVEEIGQYRLRWHWEWGHADFLVLSSTELLELKEEREPYYWYFKGDGAGSRSLNRIRTWVTAGVPEHRLDFSKWRSLNDLELKSFQLFGFVKSERHIPVDHLMTMRLAIIDEVPVVPLASARKLESGTSRMIAGCLKPLAAQIIGWEPDELEDPKACVVFNNTNLECEQLRECIGGRLSTRQIAGIYNGRDPLVQEGELRLPRVWIAVMMSDQQTEESGNLVLYPGSHVWMADMVAMNGRDYYKFSQAKSLTEFPVRDTAFPVRACEPEVIRMAEGSVVVGHGTVMFGHLANRHGGNRYIMYVPFYEAKKAVDRREKRQAKWKM